MPRISQSTDHSEVNAYWSLRDTQEKPTRHESSVVLDESCAGGHDGPYNHPCTHVDSGVDFRDEHVTRNLHQDVTDKKTGTLLLALLKHIARWVYLHADRRVELDTSHAQILLQAIQASLRNRIPVNVIEEVHRTQYRLTLVNTCIPHEFSMIQTYHKPPINLPHKRNLFRIRLRNRTRMIYLLKRRRLNRLFRKTILLHIIHTRLLALHHRRSVMVSRSCRSHLGDVAGEAPNKM